MKPDTDKPKKPGNTPAAKADPKDDLKSLPMPEVMKKLGSSADGLTEPRRRSGWRNTALTRSRKRKPIRS